MMNTTLWLSQSLLTAARTATIGGVESRRRGGVQATRYYSRLYNYDRDWGPSGASISTISARRLFSSPPPPPPPLKQRNSATELVGKLLGFAAIGATCLVTVNYLSSYDSSNSSSSSEGPVAPPQAAITSKAYLDVTIDQKPVGRIVLGLYGDVVPKTVQNFEVLCRGDTVYDNRLPLSYQNTKFHRIIPGFMLQSGDFVLNNGTGGRSIYGGRFEDENFQLRHTGPGVLSMANAGPDTNGSQFFITTAKTSHLNHRHVVFGTVLEGWEVVKAIEDTGTPSGTPTADVRIAACGVLPAEARTVEEETATHDGNEKK